MLSKIFTYVGSLAMSIISFLGYFGIFFLMILESMVFPVPSELVMPFAGFLAAIGKLNFFLVILASSIGSLIGSLLSYYIGFYGGNVFIEKYGRYFFLNKEHLKKTEKWFKRKGERTIFISRFIPVVRHLISIPAGMGKMNLKKFSLYTIVGATLWNTFLAYLGFVLGKNWTLIRKYTEPISILIVLILIFIVIYFIYKNIKNKKR